MTEPKPSAPRDPAYELLVAALAVSMFWLEGDLELPAPMQRALEELHRAANAARMPILMDGVPPNAQDS